jgi:hypothetical protein
MKPIRLTLGDKSSSADGLKHLDLFQVRFLEILPDLCKKRITKSGPVPFPVQAHFR